MRYKTHVLLLQSNTRIKTSGINRTRRVNVRAIDITPGEGNRDTVFPIEDSDDYTALLTATSAEPTDYILEGKWIIMLTRLE